MVPKNDWAIESAREEGFHAVFEAGKSACTVLSFYRLNLGAGNSFTYNSGDKEMNFVLTAGEATASFGLGETQMYPYDSFYVPGNSDVSITAVKDCVFYIPAAPCEGYGKVFFRRYDPSLPVGDIHQVHGTGAAMRGMNFTIDPAVPASRLLCGICFGEYGKWTSWKPHQHSESLEEAYSYFGMGDKVSGYQICYQEPGGIGNADIYPVKDGTIVMIPEGYHPTVSFPGSKNVYLWSLAAFTHELRRYDLGIDDPEAVWEI